jgi:hypothetical protein
MNTYRHPASYRPPLAYGGHSWELARYWPWYMCSGCFVTVPAWAIRERWWSAFAGAYCLGAVRALPSGPTIEREAERLRAEFERIKASIP